MKKKNIVFGVSGGIAAYKSADLARKLTKKGYNIHPVMTKNATEFISPLTFECLTGNECLVKMFNSNKRYDIQHISLSKIADLIVIVPASANLIAKLACGIADDLLTTTVLASKCRKIIFPAMNSNMYENSITKRNISTLKKEGFIIVEPENGLLACGDVGKGCLLNVEDMVEIIEEQYKKYAMENSCKSKNNRDLKDKKILITAGATKELIDPVRYITNHSTGKMGYALANRALLRGASITFISTSIMLEHDKCECIKVETADEMYKRVMEYKENQNAIIMAAAVGDYTPKRKERNKIKKKESESIIELVKTKDILKGLGNNRPKDCYLCGFSMETENLIENSIKKLKNKKVDLIVANDLTLKGSGFSGNTNKAVLIKPDSITDLPLMTKDELADKVLNVIFDLRQ